MLGLTYEKAMRLYFNSKREVDLIEGAAKAACAPHKEKMALLSQWMETKALEEGLKNVGVAGLGTGYWATHISATVADKDTFFDFVREHQAWDLLESRASKTAVKSYIEGHNAPVPGVNFSQTQVFNIRQAIEKAEA